VPRLTEIKTPTSFAMFTGHSMVRKANAAMKPIQAWLRDFSTAPKQHPSDRTGDGAK
jgi:hypothetical protein